MRLRHGRIPRAGALGLLLFAPVLAASALCALAADQPRSLALKELAPARTSFRMQPDSSNEKMWDAFLLVRRANSGDPAAEHELGLRYLMGEDFTADTAKAVLWIRKAASQNLLSARYNLGILLNNGCGVGWNPFEAFSHFQYGARHGLVEAEYVYGLLLTDNLVVQRNYPEAYRWIRSAADSGYAPAKETLDDFERRGVMTRIRALMRDSSSYRASARSKRPKTGPGPPATLQPLDVDLASDSVVAPDDGLLLKEAISAGRRGAAEANGRQADSPAVGMAVDSTLLHALSDAADGGSPEALTLIGRNYEQGRGVRQDFIQAAVYYLRAIRFDSPWAPVLLWRMIRTEGYFRLLKRRVEEKDRDAAFVWAGLAAFGFDRQLTGTQALGLLRQAAGEKSLDALVELAVCYSAGYWVAPDRQKAMTLLKEAEQSGSREARIRLTLLELQNDADPADRRNLLETLEGYEQGGSVLAQAMLGYCYEEGKGVTKNLPMALRWYREAASRGSRIAYEALRRLYDSRRPAGRREFQIMDDVR